MNRSKSPPPVDLEKYLEGKKHRCCTYAQGARLYAMAYWSFVNICKEAKANIKLRKTALVDLDVLDEYIEKNCILDLKREDEDMARRKLVDNIEELVKEGKKKYVRYAEGAELYSMGLHTFEQLAKDAKATRKVKGVVLCNTEKIDAFIESFQE
jgi:predicted nucleic acid-binding OB-fold protein